ncbi:MAG: YbhB/YbcL family Raf kinase inhibitor-like protein [Micavibrio aeruginosavorus]|uniref:YbhB/YbcL family Raf kinase inhibitor-like protein n=1 Tax=Micavibrio aeruginosavorus TaxID=349221 RepID=A0A7T5UGW2_9BACT|nr:MAG: YbhB/YbcL family Raf kinase inhibitor-like protein [Micavibrio aeruginosavorus]
MKLESADFSQGGDIPRQYTCSGRDISPQVTWSDVPVDTKSFALIVDDPDAPSGTWVHWVAYNIPGNKRGLPENVDAILQMQDGTRQGRNDFLEIGYGGPCPPQGHGSHRYFFKLYALDSKLDLLPGASKSELERAMEGHILAQAETMGRYER